jgi:CPA2 family monovalent cation:H+ antiporter-2
VADPHFLSQLLLVLALAALGVALFERLRLPSIAGFLLIGALVGPGGLDLGPDPDSVRTLAGFGVVLLLFEIGLELPLASLRRNLGPVVLAGGLQVALTCAIVSGAALALGAAGRSAVALGGLVAMSSTAIVMRILAERGETDAPHGQLAVGILLFQDLCIVGFLVGLPILAGAVAPSPGPIALAAGKAVIALLAIFAATRFALPWLLDRFARLRSRDLFSLLSMLIAVGSAVAAEEMGLTHAVGAFSAGIVLGSSPYAHQLSAEIVPLRGVLLGIFFTAVGMLFDASQALALWRQVALYVVAVMGIKAVIVTLVVGLVLGRGTRLGVLTGLALAQTGEFSFVLADAAVAAGAFDPELLQVFVAGSIATLLAAPFLIRAAPRLADWLSRRPAPAAHAAAHPAEAAGPHVAIVGYGLTGRTLSRVLDGARVPWLAVDANPQAARRAEATGGRVRFGDATRREILASLGVARARLVVVAVSDPLATRAVIAMSRALAPTTPVLVRTLYAAEIDELQRAGATAVVAAELEATLDLISAVMRSLAVPEEAVARVEDALRDEGYEALRASSNLLLDPWFEDLLREATTDWIAIPDGPAAGRSIEELAIRTRTGASILAVRHGEQIERNPPPERRLEAGEELLALGEPEALERLRALVAAAGAS